MIDRRKISRRDGMWKINLTTDRCKIIHLGIYLPFDDSRSGSTDGGLDDDDDDIMM